jgi:hypothetical protein
MRSTTGRSRAILLAALLGAACEREPSPAVLAADCGVPARDGAPSGVDASDAAGPSDRAAPPEAATDATSSSDEAGDAAGADATRADATSETAPDATPDEVEAGADPAGSCTDRRKNGDETDVDCGGSCAPCGANKSCRLNADCSATASGCNASQGGCRCDVTSKRCVYSHCFDNVSDDGESGLDCGGDLCAACALGQACARNADCTSGACDGISSKCVANTCLDHHQDGRETDADCGGANSCSRCRPGAKCLVDSDCQVGHTCSTDGSEVCI